MELFFPSPFLRVLELVKIRQATKHTDEVMIEYNFAIVKRYSRAVESGTDKESFAYYHPH
jgi:hypothetical protein